MRRIEVGFLVAVVAMLVVSMSAAFVVGSPSEEPQESFDLDIDREYEPPSVPDQSTATVENESFETAQAAIDAAEPGDTVVLEGRFDERLAVNTSDVTVRASDEGAVIDGGGEGQVLVVGGEDVTVENLWVRNSGYSTEDENAGVFVAGNGTTLDGLYASEIAYGIWIDGVDDVTVAESRIEGREDVYPMVERGNGIHLWQTEDTTLRDNEITAVRDGIYFSWATNVVAEENTMWNSRYGVHYMYSNENRLENNLAVDNDVGYALMVSEELEIIDNTAVRNTGTSGHGILMKDIWQSNVTGNEVIENSNGLYVYNAQDNRIADNLVLRNGVGIHSTAGSEGQEVVANSFIGNDDPVVTTTQNVESWNGTDRGNYWSDAHTVDLDNDGTSEVRHRPAGLVEHLVNEHPQAAVFADSPAFDAVRLAESSFPVVEAPGIVDRHPLVEPPHDDWRHYEDTR